MNDSESFDRLAADDGFQRYLGMMVRVMQIIVFALVMGVAIFAVIVLVMKGFPAAALAASGSLLGWMAPAQAQTQTSVGVPGKGHGAVTFSLGQVTADRRADDQADRVPHYESHRRCRPYRAHPA